MHFEVGGEQVLGVRLFLGQRRVGILLRVHRREPRVALVDRADFLRRQTELLLGRGVDADAVEVVDQLVHFRFLLNQTEPVLFRLFPFFHVQRLRTNRSGDRSGPVEERVLQRLLSC